ncbi:MAG: sulfurtransferase [Myxococcales bacterium]|nr:MAG: sulfurtransferase [Myxococcales bacterium]
MSQPLISVAELQSLLGEVTVLDVRYRLGGPPGVEEFARGHVPGAAYVDLDLDLADVPGGPDGRGGRHPLPEPFRFVGAMRAAGVSNDRPVVVYDDWQSRAAARAWWLLRHYGHQDVRVLDGGWSAWVQDGGDVSTEAVEQVPGDFSGAPGHLRTLAADDVLAFDGTLVDARNPERFRGEEEPVDPVAGHIPGAVNVPTGANLDESGRFRPASELADLYPDGEVAAYCGSGVTAAHDLLALAVAGREGALYPGSWSEWVNAEGPERPVERD